MPAQRPALISRMVRGLIPSQTWELSEAIEYSDEIRLSAEHRNLCTRQRRKQASIQNTQVHIRVDIHLRTKRMHHVTSPRTRVEVAPGRGAAA